MDLAWASFITRVAMLWIKLKKTERPIRERERERVTSNYMLGKMFKYVYTSTTALSTRLSGCLTLHSTSP